MPTASRATFILDRWQVLSVVKAVARALDLGEREITVLSAHLSVLSKGPVRSDQVLVSYAGLPALLERANCMDERRFRRGETRLEAAGLIRRKFSANSRRFPIRDGRGTVVDAYGIDLRPLFERVPALLELQAQLDAEQAELNAVRTRISARLSEARRDLVACVGCVPDWLADLTLAARNILRRTSVTKIELDALEATVNSALAEDMPNMTEAVPDNPAEGPGQNVRHSESPKKEIKDDSHDDLETTLSVCTDLHGFLDGVPGTRQDLLRWAYTFCGYLGISQETRMAMAGRLSSVRLLKVLNHMVKHIHEIKHPDLYVRKMLEKGADRLRRGSPTLSAYDRGHNTRLAL